MCEALDELLNESRQEGLQEGRQEGLQEGIAALIELCKELGIRQQETVMRIMAKFAMSQQEAENYVRGPVLVTRIVGLEDQCDIDNTMSEPLRKRTTEEMEEGITMFEALQGLFSESRQEGRQEGRLEGLQEGIAALIEVCKEFGIRQQETVMRIMAKFTMSRREAENYVARCW